MAVEALHIMAFDLPHYFSDLKFFFFLNAFLKVHYVVCGGGGGLLLFIFLF